VAWWYRQNMIVFERRRPHGRWWRRAWHDT